MTDEGTRVGTPFTARKIRDEETTFDDVGWSAPWTLQGDFRAWVNKQLVVELNGCPNGHHFKPHEDTGWYLWNLARLGDMIDRNIAAGDCNYTAHAALQFGALWRELELKLAREELFLFGLRSREHRRSGGVESHKGPPNAVRWATWQKHYAACGKLTQADWLAARELGLSEATMRGLRLRMTKDAAASD